MIKEEDIRMVEEATDIVELVSKYVKLEKYGSGYRGICPFHDDKNPSLSVSVNKKIAKCMVCGGGGRPVKFLMKIKNITQLEALKELADNANIKLDIHINKKTGPDYSNYYKIMQLSADTYSKILNQSTNAKEALEYLHKRDINDEIIETFNIGLSLDKPDILYNVLKTSDVLELDMEDLGLVNKNNFGYYDVFTKRIMFPIKDVDNNVIGFSGRIYQKSKKDEAKYINSKETKLFIKGDVLYNLNNAKLEMTKKNRVILYEGFMDVIASYKAGLKEAICSMGTALTINQAKLIKRFTKNVILCYDADSAGVNSALKAYNILTQQQIDVKLVLLPNKLDPDDYYNKYGKEAYQKYFNENVIDIYEYNYKVIVSDKDLTDFNNIEEVKNKMFEVLNNCPSSVLVEKYLSRLANDLNITQASVISDYSNYYINNPPSNIVENPSYYQNDDFNERTLNIIENRKEVVKGLDDFGIASITILKFAQLNRESAFKIDAQIPVELLEDKHRIIWMKLIDSYYVKYVEFDINVFMNMLEPEERNWLIFDENAYNKIPRDPLDDDNFNKSLLQFEILKYKTKIEMLDLEIASYATIKEELGRILAKKFEVRKKLNELEIQKRNLNIRTKETKKG